MESLCSEEHLSQDTPPTLPLKAHPTLIMAPAPCFGLSCWELCPTRVHVVTKALQRWSSSPRQLAQDEMDTVRGQQPPLFLLETWQRGAPWASRPQALPWSPYILVPVPRQVPVPVPEMPPPAISEKPTRSFYIYDSVLRLKSQ